MNVSALTSLIALITTLIGYFFSLPLVLTMGLFALSGACTNWLAIHMLFEKVPGLYGSGVIEAKFENFKVAIKDLMMTEFFSDENIDKFLSDNLGQARHFDFAPVIENIDFDPAYESLVDTVLNSQFGDMLKLAGGRALIDPLKEPYIDKLKQKLIDITQTNQFDELLKQSIEQPNIMAEMREKVSQIIDARLNELTAKAVKEIVHKMINEHLGWLVIWGGIFGGLFGLVAHLV
ncbi:hypothetical protein DS2_01793 [Catenovulum agarivorans DS-2]|uniref:DUF445 domain-containing protein n=1 Tax=Catenovulum agarivorans DS-2 TaxID=1328313 RepID=W7QVW9_9ALTE|nr:hypothetical protein [Catenovulum agarivorans]EWH11878.1 hypothetical protein DS2_01793 [Catenovulum agarivorans DS-2]